MKNIFSRYFLARNTAALSLATTDLIRVILVARDKTHSKVYRKWEIMEKFIYIHMGNQEKINNQVSERSGNEKCWGTSHLFYPICLSLGVFVLISPPFICHPAHSCTSQLIIF